MDQLLASFDVHFYWGIAAFVVFVLVLYRMGVKHILVAVEAREERIRSNLAEAELAATKAKQVRADLDKQMREAEGRIQEMIAEARRDAEALKSSMLDQGRSEVEAIRTRALREIEAARFTAIVSLRREVTDLSMLVAEKAIGERLNQSKHEQLVADAITRFEAQQGAK